MLATRALGGSVVAGAMLATVVTWQVLPSRALSVFGQGDVFAVVWPLVPVLLAAVIPASTAFRTRTIEAMSVRTLPVLRFRSTVAVAVAGVVIVVTSGYGTTVPARNTAFLIGLAYASVVLLPSALAWAPAVMYPVLGWLLGTRSSGLHAAWVVPLRPPTDHRALVISYAVGAIGWVLFVALGPLRTTTDSFE